jgi:hypothetical protein
VRFCKARATENRREFWEDARVLAHATLPDT